MHFGRQLRGGRFLHDERLTGQRGSTLVTRVRQTMLGSGQMIAIQDTHPITRNGFGQQAAELSQDRLETVNGVTHQLRGDGIFDASEFIVNGGEGDRDVHDLIDVGGPDGGIGDKCCQE